MIQVMAADHKRYENGALVARLDLQVSTTEELPHIGDTVKNYTVAAGTIAQIIQSDEPTFLTLDEDDNYYPTQSDSTNKALSLSPTLNKAVRESTDDAIDLTEEDIDKINDELGLEPFPDSEPTESEVTEDER